MKNFDVLDASTELLGYHVLEASAGTGKTFAIQHICTRLLLEKGMKWEDILIVTFTKEACALLKTRVRKTLEESCHPLRAHHLACIDKMQIFTIHGFCYRMLNIWAFDANIAFCHMDPEGLRPSLVRCIEDVLRTKEFASLYTPAQMQIVLENGDINALFDKVLAHVGKKRLHIEDATFKGIVDFLSAQEAFDLFTEFEHAAQCYKGMQRRDFIEQAELLHAIVQKKNHLEQGLDALLGYEELFFAKMHDGNKKVKGSIQGFERLQAWGLSLYPLLERAKDPEILLSSFIALCQKHVEKNGLGTYDSLLATMLTCTENETFASRLRSQYKAVIIDEFQDTDATQWDIFRKLFVGHVQAFYVVGDPKQSIYGFRLADVYTYLGAKKELESLWGAHTAALGTNYRSDPDLVFALNALFKKAGNWMPLPSMACSLDVPSVSAGVVASSVRQGFCVHVFASSCAHPEEDFFHFIAQEVGKWKKEECAILVRDRYQAKKMQMFLEERGISTCVSRPGSLLGSDAWHAMEELLEAVQDPFDVRKVRAAALGPHMFCDVEEASSLFLSWHRTWKKRGFVFFYKEFIKKFPQEGAFQQLADLLMRGETLKSLSLLDPDDPRLIISAAGGDKGVRILTMHMSKGLEFPVVFALGLAKRSSEKEEEKIAEEMRLLYVTLTRAKKQLYIPLPLQGRKDTPVERFYLHIDKSMSLQCLDELGIGYTVIARENTCEKSPVLKKDPLCKQEIVLPSYFQKFLFSFSSIAEKNNAISMCALPVPEISAGPETGIVLHRILERVFSTDENIESIIFSCIQGTHLMACAAPIFNLIEQTLYISLGDFCVQDIKKKHVRTEMEFFFPVDGGMMKGVIDLFFYINGKYYLLDWKTNYLPGYSQDDLKAVMEEKEYFLQGKIYMQAAQRYVQLFDKRPFEECFGGMFYVFVRGAGVYHIPYR